MRGCLSRDAALHAAQHAPHRPRCRARCFSYASSRQRVPKDPARWGKDYDAIRRSLEAGEGEGGGGAHALPTFGKLLNFLGSTFGGATTARLAQSEKLSDKALGMAWQVLRQLGPREDEHVSRNDPTVLAAAAQRASPEERAEALAAWGTRDDAEKAVLLAVGCATAPPCSVGVSMLTPARTAAWPSCAGTRATARPAMPVRAARSWRTSCRHFSAVSRRLR